jgi:DNA repair exonuclease SbcCD ATPase subunit
MTTKADKLRAQRALLIADRRSQRDGHVAARKAAEDKFAAAQAALDKAAAHLERRCKAIDSDVAALDVQIREAEIAEKKQQLLEVAREIDEAETPERWARFDKLCMEIPNKQSYELRSMNRRRMKSDKDVAALGRPYPTIAAWAAAMTGAS